jgi:hypothetical protein
MVIKTLDPDPDSPALLDPDLDSMNPDLQYNTEFYYPLKSSLSLPV